jgi:hypothetical protein
MHAVQSYSIALDLVQFERISLPTELKTRLEVQFNLPDNFELLAALAKRPKSECIEVEECGIRRGARAAVIKQ